MQPQNTRSECGKAAFLTFPQARARFAHSAVKTLTRAQIVAQLGISDDPKLSHIQLAYKLAFKLLPAGPDRLKGGAL